MDITVSFRHTEPIESLKAYAEEKMSKMKKYLDTPLEAHIVLSIEKFRHQADVTLSVNGTRIKGVEETGDMYSAIDQVMDKIEKQLKRHLAKIRSRRPENIKGEDALALEEAVEAGEMEREERTIEVERLVAKPMDPEEAAMQLELSQQDFLVFRNARSREINVIYLRRDGNLGLIEPAA
ncbi:MAG: ribosome-associated translation inhibitor RaiA [Deltaproteobacteria bacterium]|nr:ribosome-associated translation inhibitor RaiA [Deltaproteobacteria bacterium]MBW1924648.1 ribosome-associated translation inhibitor RaiA [Deltaproteobacteria bacterium]MBW1950520.1 ribosome-associated translation inhibitor RaiA [Deltaproteobacteria bacterium]MBW2008519.1 ribosome-associated translation inhibitor RaiA [Deltaproteobacteria bacterium]MBW2103049.1 ribosome-associated translation inhibitor RaiA [Deltaproteobacteria bacterium]